MYVMVMSYTILYIFLRNSSPCFLQKSEDQSIFRMQRLGRLGSEPAKNNLVMISFDKVFHQRLYKSVQGSSIP